MCSCVYACNAVPDAHLPAPRCPTPPCTAPHRHTLLIHPLCSPTTHRHAPCPAANSPFDSSLSHACTQPPRNPPMLTDWERAWAGADRHRQAKALVPWSKTTLTRCAVQCMSASVHPFLHACAHSCTHVWMCMCTLCCTARACMHACVRVCVRACVRACELMSASLSFVMGHKRVPILLGRNRNVHKTQYPIATCILCCILPIPTNKHASIQTCTHTAPRARTHAWERALMHSRTRARAHDQHTCTHARTYAQCAHALARL